MSIDPTCTVWAKDISEWNPTLDTSQVDAVVGTLVVVAEEPTPVSLLSSQHLCPPRKHDIMNMYV